MVRPTYNHGMGFLIIDDPLSAVIQSSNHSPLMERFLPYGRNTICT